MFLRLLPVRQSQCNSKYYYDRARKKLKGDLKKVVAQTYDGDSVMLEGLEGFV